MSDAALNEFLQPQFMTTPGILGALEMASTKALTADQAR
jgi:hypothetical protein